MFFIGVSMFLLSFRLALSSSAMTLSLIISILLISSGIYLIFISLPWYVILRKFVGLIIFIFGYFMVFIYPGESDYQPPGYTMLGVIGGILFLIIGIYLLIF